MFSTTNSLMYSSYHFDDIAPTWPSFDPEDKKYLAFGNKLGLREGEIEKAYFLVLSTYLSCVTCFSLASTR